MQVTETLSEGLKREYRIVVPAADIEGRIDERLDELGRTTPIDGFRPGKAPRALLRQRFGKAVRGEVVGDAIEKSWRQAAMDRGVKPAMAPKIDVASAEAGADLEYTLALEALPDFEPAGIKGMKLERLVADVTEARVEAALAGLADKEKTFRPADDGHAAAPGDAVRISFEGRIDGEPFEGGAAKDIQVVLGSGSFPPGFEEGLAGVRKGETRTVSATWPEGLPNAALAGKTASFTVTVADIQVPEAVAVNDALAARFGMADLAALRAAVRERGQREYRSAARLKLKRQILDKLAEDHTFAVPAGMVDQEFESIWRQIEQDMKRTGEKWDESGEDEANARKEYREIAERRVRLGLVLSEIGSRNDITVPREELNRAMMERARMFPGEEQRIFDMFRSNPEMLGELHAPLLEDKVIDFIVEMADVTERTVSERELLAPVEDSGNSAEARAAGEAGIPATDESAGDARSA